MFNLLPDSLKNDIAKEYNFRRLIVALLFIVFIQISFLVLMLPSWVSSYYKEKESQLKSQKMDESSLISNFNSIKPAIKILNNELSIIDKYLDYPKAAPYISSILSKKTNAIHITDFLYTTTGSSTATVLIQGVSDTRDSLVSFKKNLDDSKIFKTIDLPISNYAKDKNINFSMTLLLSGNI